MRCFACQTASQLMTCTAISVIGMDIYAVTDRIVGQCRLQFCRMVVTIYRRLTKSFPPTWQHHHLMIASTTVPIIQWQLIFFLGVDQYTKANLRLDASLPPCTLRKSKEEKGTRRLRQPTIAEQLRFMSTLTKKGPPFSSGDPRPARAGNRLRSLSAGRAHAGRRWSRRA